MRIPAWACGFCILLSAAVVLADPPKRPRIEGVDILPDQGWTDNPDCIWYDSFDGSDDLLSRYLEYSSDRGDCRPVTSEALGDEGKSLRVIFQAGEVGAGGVKKCFGRNPMDYRGLGVRPTEDFREVYWRQYVKMQPGWVGNPAKLNRAIAFAGSNWSEAMIAHVWGGNRLNLCIDPASGVNEQSQVVTTRYNDFANLTWLGYRHGDTQLFDTDEAGRWVCIETHVRLNTPGHSDGVFTLTIDGQVEAGRDDLNWVYAWDDYGINAVFLENYWNAGSPVRQERWFDDFVISTSPIGPATSPLNPTVTKTAFRDVDAGDVQSAWQLQVASGIAGADVVWDSGAIAGVGDCVAIDAASGTFLGSLTGEHELEQDHLYALRARQRDAGGAWSTWSDWATTLRTGALTPGDANGDGCVDGTDLAVWQQYYDPLGLAPNTFARGDWNGDGRIDGGDLALWQQNYRPVAGGAGPLYPLSEVPEPTTVGLFLLGATLAAACRKRRRCSVTHVVTGPRN